MLDIELIEACQNYVPQMKETWKVWLENLYAGIHKELGDKRRKYAKQKLNEAKRPKPEPEKPVDVVNCGPLVKLPPGMTAATPRHRIAS